MLLRWSVAHNGYCLRLLLCLKACCGLREKAGKRAGGRGSAKGVGGEGGAGVGGDDGGAPGRSPKSELPMGSGLKLTSLTAILTVILLLSYCYLTVEG